MDGPSAASLLAFAEKHGARVTGDEGKAALDDIERRHDELTAAIQWFVDEGRTDEALRLANALYRFWNTKQRFADGNVWLHRALAAPGGEPRLRGTALVHAAFMPFWLGDDDAAATDFRQALEIGRELDDPTLISQALGGLVRVALRSDVPEARRLAREALAVAEAANDERSRSNAIHLLGVGAQIAGDLVEARDWMTRRLAIVRSQGNQLLIASEAANLSMVERQLGELDTAEALEIEALEITDRSGDEFTKPFAIAGLAAIATERGQHERAATLVGAAEAIMERHAMAWPPDERPHYEKMLVRLPAAMGDSAFEAARAAGYVMATEDAVAFALDRPPATPTG